MDSDNGTYQAQSPQTIWEAAFRVAERYGIAVVLSAVLLYWGREDRQELCKRLDERDLHVNEQNEWIQTKLIATIENNTKAFEAFTIQHSRDEQTIAAERAKNELQRRTN